MWSIDDSNLDLQQTLLHFMQLYVYVFFNYKVFDVVNKFHCQLTIP